MRLGFSRRNWMQLSTWVITWVGLLMNGAVLAEPIARLNMTRGVTPISRDVYDLHMTVIAIVCGIAVVVFGVLFYSLFAYRKSKGAVAAKFHENFKIEIIWTIIPVFILVGMAVPATKVIGRMYDSSDAQVNIKIVGYQWKWKYEYLDEGFGFFSNLSTPQDEIQNKAPKNRWYLLEVDKPMVVPIHKKIRFLVTSNDVIHSWWVPAFSIKRDAIPGFIHEAWAVIDRPGIYRGQCAELCGLNHGFMPIVVKAVTEQEYQAWIAKHREGQTAAAEAAAEPPKEMSKDELMTLGKKVYMSHCAVCHKPTGEGMPPAFPALKGGKITTGPVSGHIDVVLHGVTGTAMQAFGSQLTDQDIAAVVTYERNDWGNADKAKYGQAAGGIVQPAEVAKARNK